MSKRSSGGADGIGAFLVGVVVLIALVPKPVWIFLGVLAGTALVAWIVIKIVNAVERNRIVAQEQARIEQAALAEAAKRRREENARREKQQRVATLGERNASRVESALRAAEQVAASEAARAGWLGDVDFHADIAWITGNFAKAHDLRIVTDKLVALDKPSADDRRIIASAQTTIAGLEKVAIDRAELIGRCAREAQLIDKSLRTEREDSKRAEQRAELHGKLSAMLYGIEAAPDGAPSNSAVDAVMARVQAYREIKQQIDKARAIGA